jgi:hypothetical protein
MSSGIYRYTFQKEAAPESIEAAIVLAIFGVEVLHGAALARMDAGHFFDRHRMVCVIDANTEVGLDMARLFTGFLQRELEPESFKVERVLHASPPLSASLN